MSKWIIICLSVMAGLWLSIIVGAFFVQERLLFHPDPTTLIPPPKGIEHLTLTTEDGETIYAFYKPAISEDCPTVLFMHGNAGRIDRNLYRFDETSPSGMGLMLLEWRGYAGSTGYPSERGFHLDAKAGWDWLTGPGGLAPKNIVVHGFSIGSGPATKLARDVDPAMLIIEAPYFSMLDLVQRKARFLPVRFILKHTFRSDLWIGDVNSPILMAHGGQDNVIASEQSQRLLERTSAPSERWFSAEANHNNLTAFGLYDQAIIPFLRRYGFQNCGRPETAP